MLKMLALVKLSIIADLNVIKWFELKYCISKLYIIHICKLNYAEIQKLL